MSRAPVSLDAALAEVSADIDRGFEALLAVPPDSRGRLYQAHPGMGRVDARLPSRSDDVFRLAERAPQTLSGPPFVSPIKDFYLTNPIARASAVMAECSALQFGPAAQAAE